MGIVEGWSGWSQDGLRMVGMVGGKFGDLCEMSLSQCAKASQCIRRKSSRYLYYSPQQKELISLFIANPMTSRDDGRHWRRNTHWDDRRVENLAGDLQPSFVHRISWPKWRAGRSRRNECNERLQSYSTI